MRERGLMQSHNTRTGKRGEGLAETFLRSRGFRIIARNARVGRLGEIDLIAEQRGRIVFVEVKARHGAGYGTPEEALTAAKRLHFRRAVEAWLLSRGLTEAPYRADVIAIDFSGGLPTIRHLEAVEL